MTLDYATVFIYSGALTLFVCVVTGLAWRAGEVGSETRYWFLASVLQLAGSILMSVGDFIPLQLGGYVAGVTSTAATGFLALGYRHLYGERSRISSAMGVAFVTGTAIYLTKLLSGGHQDGIYLIYIGGAINLASAAAAVWRGARVERLHFGRIAAWMLTVYAATYAAVAPCAFFFPIQFVDGKPVSAWLQATTIPLVLLNLGAYLMTLVLKLERMTERQRHLAAHDPLTGILNRGAFYHAWEQHAGEGGVLAVIDLDHFKAVNDNHGHQAGDAVLKALTGVVAERLPPEAVFGRLGGEEFGIYLPHCGELEAVRLLEELRKAASAIAIRSRSGAMFGFTFSCGLVGFGPGTSDPDHAFATADRALYMAKSTGRDRVVAFDPVTALQADAMELRSRPARSAPAERISA